MVLKVTSILNSKINIITKSKVSIFKKDEVRGGELAQRQRGIGLTKITDIFIDMYAGILYLVWIPPVQKNIQPTKLLQ